MKYTLITGIGRSGSVWLSGLLSQMARDQAMVAHEMLFTFDVEEGWERLSKGTFQAREYWEKRAVLMSQRVNNGHPLIELSGLPRHFLEGVKDPFTETRVILLTRDPRKVVPSIAERGNYASRAPRRQDLHFNPAWIGDPVEGWEKLPRLHKICWLWKTANDKVLNHTESYVRLEDLVNSFSAVKRICAWCGIKADKETWDRVKKEPKNQGSGRSKPYEKWTVSDQKALLRICGPTMKFLSYHE